MNTLNLTFPFQKINHEQRIVTGIATADNIDLVNDKVAYEASLEAFSQWVGNIREMHAPMAVGKLVDYRPIKVIHGGREYNAIEVSVYISKGAQDTWEKILDGTLKGFSIGGKVIEHEEVWDEDHQTMINLITKYMLGELSVVDNPCNPIGLFAMIKMADDGNLIANFEGEKSSVYYCETHKFATIEGNEFCPTCAEKMQKIGYVEKFDATVINKMIADFEIMKGGKSIDMDLHENEKDASISSMDELTDQQKSSVVSKVTKFLFGEEEGEATTASTPVTNITVNITPEVIEKAAGTCEHGNVKKDCPECADQMTKEAADGEAEVSAEDATVEKVADNKEDEEMDLEKVLEGIGSLLDEKLEKVKADIEASVDEKIEKSVTTVKDEVQASLDEQKEEIEKVANTGAMQKSVEEIDETVEETDLEKRAPEAEGFWGGNFVPREIAKALGYDS